MTPFIAEFVAGAGNSFAVSIIAKATLAMVVVLIAAWLTRKSRASARHLIFTAGFVALLVLPLATIVLPAVEVPLPIPDSSASPILSMTSGSNKHAARSNTD